MTQIGVVVKPQPATQVRRPQTIGVRGYHSLFDVRFEGGRKRPAPEDPPA